MGATVAGRQEVQVSPFPAGSARKMDYTFPDWWIQGNGGGTTNLTRDRPGAQNASPSGSTSPGATGTIVLGVVNGVSCVRLQNALGTGPVIIADGSGRFHIATLSANVSYSTTSDDFACQRVYMIARMTGNPGSALDSGLQLVLGGNAGSGILQAAVPGVGIQFDTTGGCSYIQHGNSGAQTSTLLRSAAQGFVNTQYHKFEFRFINATPQTNGVMKVFLDDALALTKNFGSVPDDLPLPTSPGANANNGYVAHAILNAVSCEMDVVYLRVQRGPTEQAVIS